MVQANVDVECDLWKSAKQRGIFATFARSRKRRERIAGQPRPTFAAAWKHALSLSGKVNLAIFLPFLEVR
jgi:hypothetical protein